jgi:hypothetical protein
MPLSAPKESLEMIVAKKAKTDAAANRVRTAIATDASLFQRAATELISRNASNLASADEDFQKLGTSIDDVLLVKEDATLSEMLKA